MTEGYLSLYGTGAKEDEVRAAFPAGMREWLQVMPRYARTELPRLLAAEEVLLFSSHSVGLDMAPVSSPVGVAPQVVHEGETGRLIPIGDVSALHVRPIPWLGGIGIGGGFFAPAGISYAQIPESPIVPRPPAALRAPGET